MIRMENPTPTVPSRPALDIVEELVTATGTALMKDDFPSFRDRFAFPHVVITFSGERIVETEDQLRDTFDKVQTHYRLSGVERMERTVLHGEFQDVETILCAHETRLFRQDKLVQKPISVSSHLELLDGAWKITHTDYIIEDSLRYNRALTE